jgi:hypothetical protein
MPGTAPAGYDNQIFLGSRHVVSLLVRGVWACARRRVPIRRLPGRADLAGIGGGSVDVLTGRLGRYVD